MPAHFKHTKCFALPFNAALQMFFYYAYAILSEGEMILVDPARNPEPYYALARKHHAAITAVVETHPHADFVSSHLEIHRTTGAGVYVTSLVGAFYPHHNFEEGDELAVGAGKIRAINTPGHSPDSISVILTDGSGKDIAVFTGDALLIGDCGRPDLREEAGNLQLKREQQAKQMYHTLQKYLKLDDTVKVYPAHGSGSLCGRGRRSRNIQLDQRLRHRRHLSHEGNGVLRYSVE